MNTLNMNQNRIQTSQLGMMIALAAWSMLFATIIFGYAVLRVQSGTWFIPKLIEQTRVMALVNSIVIFSSSFSMLSSQRLFRDGLTKLARVRLIQTMVLGVVFLGGQLYLWQVIHSAGMTLKGSIAGSMFYLLTGLHGIHIIGGLSALGWLLNKQTKPANESVQKVRVSCVSSFWHFLTVVWFIMVTLIYIVQ